MRQILSSLAHKQGREITPGFVTALRLLLPDVAKQQLPEHKLSVSCARQKLAKKNGFRP
jgi:hypothetical protein